MRKFIVKAHMGKRLISVLLLTSLFVCNLWITVPAQAEAASSISVTLPSFKVTMNGEVVNNDYSKYPLIVYNGITYFPMTYQDCRFLGIESTWKGNTDGLLIDSTGVTAAFNPYVSTARNGKNYSATIPSFPIKVNGKAVDNSKEEYPIISFRDITYFPMTWKYCVDQFGWDYKFEGGSGLVIKSSNAKLDQVQIPKNRPVEDEYSVYPGKKSSAVMAKNGYCYYVDDKGAVMQAPLSDMSKTKKVFQLETWSYGDGKTFDMHNFYEENGKAMLFFHSGGAVMGSDHRYVLKEDGSTQKIQDSYWETTMIGDKLYMYWIGPTPGPGNLYVQGIANVGTDDGRNRLGPADYWYGALSNINGLPMLELIGGELYVWARKDAEERDEDDSRVLLDVGIYKVNISSNALTKVSQAKGRVSNAQITGESLYYIISEEAESSYTCNVYRHSLKDGSETFLGSYKSSDYWQPPFAVVGESVYYVSERTLYRLPGNESLNPGAEVISMSLTGDNRDYFVCTFKETAKSKYRIMVFDKSGKVVFKTSDCGGNVVIEGNVLYFYNITTETLCKTVLK